MTLIRILKFNSIRYDSRFFHWVLIMFPLLTAHEIKGADSQEELYSGTLSNFYYPNEIQTVYLNIAKPELDLLYNALPERIYVPGSFAWRNNTYENVGIRFKGNSSSHPNQKHKRSFLVKFNKYEKGKQFFGLQSVSFDNGIQFGSLFSEPVLTEILRKEALITHRANYAKLFLNGRYQGVYVNVERVDNHFIQNRLNGTEGALWKVDLGGPGCNLQFISDNPNSYSQAFEKKNDLAKMETDELVDFIRFINQSDDENFIQQLPNKLALEDFLKVTAIMLFGGAFDQLTGWNPHNYHLFFNSETDRWLYMPWDLDVGFCEIAFQRIRVLEDWNAAWPNPKGEQNPLLERIIQSPELLDSYRSIAKKILEKHFQPDKLCQVFEEKYNLIKADLEKDPFPHQRATVPTDKNYEDILVSIKKFVRKRYSPALQQLTHPGPRPTSNLILNHAPSERHQRLEQRVKQIVETAEKMQRLGQNVSKIQEILRQFNLLMRQGNPDEAERLLDKAFGLLGAPTSPSALP